MKKSKLIRLLSTFDKSEIKRFSDFVASPYYNSMPELITLYNYLKKEFPLFPAEKLNKETIYKAVYPQSEFDEKQFGYLTSYLTKLIEQFFQVSLFERDDVQMNCNLLQSFLDRKLLKLYNQRYNSLEKKMNAIEKKDSKYFEQRLQISELAMQFFEMQQMRKHNQYLQEAVDNLDKFYFAEKLKYSCSMINDQKSLATTYRMDLLNEVQDFVNHSDIEQESCIELYNLTLDMLLKDEEGESFQILKDFIQQKNHSLTDIDAKYIYLYAINFCARKIRKGERKFAQEALDIYLDGIKKEFLYDEGVLSPWAYKNIINLALGLGQYDWIEDFIYTYSSKLDKGFQENALHFNLANLYFYRKEYDKSIFHLSQTQFTDIYYNLDSKVILIRIYYLLNEEDALLSLLASFSLFLKRNKSLSKNVKETYLNFCSIMSKITRKNSKKLKQIRQEIQDTKLLIGKSWLMEIVKEWEEKALLTR